MGISSQVKISDRNWLDFQNVTLTGNGDVPTLPVSSLTSTHGDDRYRIVGLVQGGLIEFEVDFGRAREVEVLALQVPRPTSVIFEDDIASIGPDETIKHVLLDELDNVVFDSGDGPTNIDPKLGYHVTQLAAPITIRKWRCVITVGLALSITGFADIQRAWAGPLFQPSVGFDIGDVRAWQSESIIQRARRGVSEFVEEQQAIQSWSLNVSFIDEADAAEFEEIERRTTTGRQILICRQDRADAQSWMLARQTTTTGLSSILHLRSTKSIRVQESI